MTRIGLVGCGRWGTLILRDLCHLGCDLVVVDSDAGARSAAAKAGAKAVFADIAAMPEQDGYTIASPPHLHATHIRGLVTRGKPIFCEKPLGTSSRELETLSRAAQPLVFCMEKWRYHPGIRRLTQMARTAELGAVVGLALKRVSGPSIGNVSSVIWHLMPHDLSIAHEILGVLPAVQASHASTIDGWAYAGSVSLGPSPWVTIETSERRGKTFREVRLVCAAAEAVLGDAYADHLTVRRHTQHTFGEPQLVPIAGEPPLLAELRVFVDFVRGLGPPPMSSFDDALSIVRHIEEIHRRAGLEIDAKKRTAHTS